MINIAKVVVDVALGKHFDYIVPASLHDAVAVGSRVVVPFGRRKISGYVVAIENESNVSNLKEITSVQNDAPFIDANIMKLSKWMSKYYCSPLEKTISTVLPSAVRREGSGHKKQLYVQLSNKNQKNSSLKLSPKRELVLNILKTHTGLFLNDLLQEAHVTASPVRALEKQGYLSITEKNIQRNPLVKHKILPTKPLKLTPEQAEALKMINAKVDQAKAAVVLLHGVTGSGKTEVYLQAIDHVLQAGQGAIVLVPEIALTPQTIKRFYSRFGERIAVLHSHLSDGERHDEWHRIHDGKADIVIGARSAVFAPVKNLGIIVIDEEHEPSYKQSEAPRYNARDVAVMRGFMENFVVLLGSATPSMESWMNTRKKKYSIARLTKRVDDRKMPAMRIVDMRNEGVDGRPKGILSSDLFSAIASRLERSEQTILFLNRRGFATSLVCQQCGYVASCDSCSVAYTYHRHDELLRCHICGASRKVPQRCPSCSDPSFKYSGIGTQKIEKVVKKCFPHANVQRMDADMTRCKESYDNILGDFRSGKIDVLIGTQMIAKGLHFPNVTLVGVVYADLSMHMPDFRAGERTFQLLAQVAGRAGRGDISGEVIIQTYTPKHVALQAACKLDYEGFCIQEQGFRQELMYPPFAHLICITIKGASEEKVSFSCTTLGRLLKKTCPASVRVSDSVPAPLAKAKGQYRYQLILRSKSVETMSSNIKAALSGLKFPDGIMCNIDVDAVSLM